MCESHEIESSVNASAVAVRKRLLDNIINYNFDQMPRYHNVLTSMRCVPFDLRKYWVMLAHERLYQDIGSMEPLSQSYQSWLDGIKHIESLRKEIEESPEDELGPRYYRDEQGNFKERKGHAKRDLRSIYEKASQARERKFDNWCLKVDTTVTTIRPLSYYDRYNNPKNEKPSLHVSAYQS